MCETGLALMGDEDRAWDRFERSKVLKRIAQSLHVPVETFYAPAQPPLDEHSVADIQTEKLLELVKEHMVRLDPPARRRFGEAVLGMIDPDAAKD